MSHPLVLLRQALRTGRQLYTFAKGGQMEIVMTTLAGTDGKAASRAVHDALRHSDRPRDQLSQAEGALRSAYEIYLRSAEPEGFRAVMAALNPSGGPEHPKNKALLNAAATALTAASVTGLAGNQSMRREWLERARDHYELYKERAHTPEPRMSEFAEPGDYGMALIGVDRLNNKHKEQCRRFEHAYEAVVAAG
ncbi:hypothetical protein ACQEUU_27955 [Nonomuraea sp. CA-218870]|uniref:hypothetical protein n=1 Tax=Nonomuraea sp. CA-218870 TaxID=3239998 RepID=UPI003D947436